MRILLLIYSLAIESNRCHLVSFFADDFIALGRGLYRDNGLLTLRNYNNITIVIIRKEITKLVKNQELTIDIISNKK